MALELCNFAQEGLISSVTCDAVVMNDYEVTNLFSKDPDKLKRGFMCETFVKAPVNIDINLQCSINLYNIIFDGKNGSQCSSGFQVLIGSLNNLNCFQSAVSVWDLKQPCLVYNPRLSQSVDFKSKKMKANNNYTFSPMLGYFRGVQRLRLCITKVNSSSIPCIKTLEIWGITSNKADYEMVGNILNPCALYNAVLPKAISTCGIPANIPEEFIDPITFDILSMPMILPSGKIVNSSTLENFYKGGQCGRVPFDPFTGKPFTEDSFPKPHIELKRKIDRLFIEHPDIFNCPGDQLNDTQAVEKIKFYES